MQSPPALTEHVSLNLAGTFLLTPVYRKDHNIFHINQEQF